MACFTAKGSKGCVSTVNLDWISGDIGKSLGDLFTTNEPPILYEKFYSLDSLGTSPWMTWVESCTPSCPKRAEINVMLRIHNTPAMAIAIGAFGAMLLLTSVPAYADGLVAVPNKPTPAPVRDYSNANPIDYSYGPWQTDPGDRNRQRRSVFYREYDYYTAEWSPRYFLRYEYRRINRGRGGVPIYNGGSGFP
jgi:hypothetical protein